MVKPVTLWVGRDMLPLSPSATGSPTAVMTIGMSRVAPNSATAAGDAEPISASGLVATSSRASGTSRERSPFAARIS